MKDYFRIRFTLIFLALLSTVILLVYRALGLTIDQGWVNVLLWITIFGGLTISAVLGLMARQNNLNYRADQYGTETGPKNPSNS